MWTMLVWLFQEREAAKPKEEKEEVAEAEIVHEENDWGKD